MTDQSIPGAGEPYSTEPDSTEQFPTATAASTRRLTRSTTDKMLGGVAGGIAEYFGVDSTWVRAAFVLSLILPGPQVLLYLLLWVIIPKG